MKRFFLTGGFIGFALTFAMRLGAGGTLNLALRDGMIGCLLVAFGFRILYRQLELGAISILQREGEELAARARSDSDSRSESITPNMARHNNADN